MHQHVCILRNPMIIGFTTLNLQSIYSSFFSLLRVLHKYLDIPGVAVHDSSRRCLLRAFLSVPSDVNGNCSAVDYFFHFSHSYFMCQAYCFLLLTHSPHLHISKPLWKTLVSFHFSFLTPSFQYILSLSLFPKWLRLLESCVSNPGFLNNHFFS